MWWLGSRMRSFCLPVMAGLIIFLTLGLPSCGYHLEGNRTPPAVRERLYIDLFANRTSRAFVNDTLTNLVVERFARSGLFEMVEDPQNADLILQGTLQKYDTAPIAYSKVDEIIAYRVDVIVQATLRRTKPVGRIDWKGDLSGSQDFSANPDRAVQQENERSATTLLCERLADELYARMADEVDWNAKSATP